MFSKHSEAFRIPFFITVSIVAMGFVMSIFRKLREDQYLLIVTLSFIVAGAIGNFVDRMRFGYVVDFIDWYVAWGGRDRHWPTFNIADVWISCGVTLMIIQSLFVKDLIPEGTTAAEPPKDTNKAESASGEREG
jgi:signal peptidase II